MIRLIQCLLLGKTLLFSVQGISQDTNSTALHFQIYDRGNCVDMYESIYYSTLRYQKSKSVLQSGSYYSTMYAYVISTDSARRISILQEEQWLPFKLQQNESLF